MVRPLLLSFAFVVFACASGASAQSGPGFPAGAEAMEAKLMSQVGPQERAWIRQEAQRQARTKNASEATVRRAVAGNPAFKGSTDRDVTSLTFLVLMQVARDAHEDQKSALRQVEASRAKSGAGDRGGLSELNQEKSLRLQSAAHRQSRMMATLSNLQKKVSDTEASTIQNVK